MHTSVAVAVLGGGQVSAWGGVGSLSGAVSAWGVCVQGGVHLPPVDRITDRCKNITFPQPRLGTVMNSSVGNELKNRPNNIVTHDLLWQTYLSLLLQLSSAVETWETYSMCWLWQVIFMWEPLWLMIDIWYLTCVSCRPNSAMWRTLISLVKSQVTNTGYSRLQAVSIGCWPLATWIDLWTT